MAVRVTLFTLETTVLRPAGMEAVRWVLRTMAGECVAVPEEVVQEPLLLSQDVTLMAETTMITPVPVPAAIGAVARPF